MATVSAPVSGYFADRTGKYWYVTFIGYSINLLVVPAMALARSWQLAAGLVLAERIGRAIRKPTVEAMLSYSTGKLGKGWVYGVNTALDETGATIGPLLMALALFKTNNYRTAYASLLISSLLALSSLVAPQSYHYLPVLLFNKGLRSDISMAASNKQNGRESQPSHFRRSGD